MIPECSTIQAPPLPCLANANNAKYINMLLLTNVTCPAQGVEAQGIGAQTFGSEWSVVPFYMGYHSIHA